MSFESMLLSKNLTFTSNEQQLVNYIYNNQSSVSSTTITQLADQVHYSPSFISKLIKKMGFTSFAEFKLELKGTIVRSPATDVMESKKIDVEMTEKLLAQTDFSTLNKLIHDAKIIYCYGTGHSQQNYMREFSRNLMIIASKPIVFLSGQNEFETVINFIDDQDIIMIASHSGETDYLVKTVKLLQIKNVPVVSFTKFSKNTLANLSTFSVYYYLTPIKNMLSSNRIVSYLPLDFCMDYIVRSYIDDATDYKE